MGVNSGGGGAGRGPQEEVEEEGMEEEALARPLHEDLRR